MKKVFGNNHDYGFVVSKLAQKALVKELTSLKQPLLAPFFNGLLVTPSPMSVLILVSYKIAHTFQDKPKYKVALSDMAYRNRVILVLRSLRCLS